MKMLVMGGAGCIGSDLAERLAALGHEITVVDNLSSGRLEHLNWAAQAKGFQFIEGDLLDLEVARRAMEGVEFVHHLAANPDVKFVEGDPTDKDLRQNVLVTYNVLEAMRLQGVKKLAFSSTSAVYGIVEQLPIAEDTVMRPISLYGGTKLGCEALISSFQHLFDMQCWIFRFANIVGAKVRKKGRTVISDFIHRLRENPRQLTILGNGRQAKSYLTSTECIDAMLHAIQHAPGNLNTFNLGADDWIEVNRIAQMVVSSMGLTDVEFLYTGTEGGWLGDVPRFRLDPSRINALGWRARYSSEQAIQMTIDALLGEANAAANESTAICKP